MLDFGYYIKSNKTLEDGTPIYFPCNLRNYLSPTYKTYIDKESGQEISIRVGYEDVKYVFSDDDIIIENGRVSHFIDLNKFIFQFNLDKYFCFKQKWASAYEEVAYIIQEQYNSVPDYLRSYGRENIKCYFDLDIEEETGYWPFTELCFCSGNNTAILNYIPDKLFFNYPQRDMALERIHPYGLRAFSNVDYINMNDKELAHFMTDRFNRRLKYEQLIKNHKYYRYATS